MSIGSRKPFICLVSCSNVSGDNGGGGGGSRVVICLILIRKLIWKLTICIKFHIFQRYTHTYRFVDVYNEEKIITNDIHSPRTKKKKRMFFENERAPPHRSINVPQCDCQSQRKYLFTFSLECFVIFSPLIDFYLP